MFKKNRSHLKKISENKKKKRYNQLKKFENIIKVKFKNKSLLNRALTHRSAVNESFSDIKDNERLEHLGDSVLGFIISEYLYKHYESFSEGYLAKIKSVVVSDDMLAEEARRMDLGSYIFMGKGEEHSGGRGRISILANTLESVIGAIYLDAGIKQCRKFIVNLMKKKIEKISEFPSIIDPKTALQEFVQKKFKEGPIYRVIEENGPAHQKEFIVKLLINGKEIITGKGVSKRKAEMNAARVTMQKINNGDSIF